MTWALPAECSTSMNIEIIEEGPSLLAAYASVPIAFEIVGTFESHMVGTMT